MRIVLIAVTAICLCVAWNCASDPPLPSETDTLKLIREGVWFRMGEREHGHCNNVVIDVGEGLLVVDANFPSGAQALMEDIKQVTTKPVSYVFDTHHHGGPCLCQRGLDPGRRHHARTYRRGRRDEALRAHPLAASGAEP